MGPRVIRTSSRVAEFDGDEPALDERGYRSWEPLSRRWEMTATITLRMIDGALGFVFPEEMVQRLQLAEGDTFLVEPYEDGVKLIPTGALLERYRAVYRRGAEKYRNALRQMADHG